MITFKNISKKYDNHWALRDINLTIYEGEFFVIVGPSGSGKTTLLKMINRLIDKTSGDITINNQSIYQQDVISLRKNVGYVLQNIALFPHLNVTDNITIGLDHLSKNEKQQKVSKLLNNVDLNPTLFSKRFPKELSGGEAQRIGIIRALANNPNIVLMDEPFSALDPISKKSLQELVLRLHKNQKRTIVFVTHDMNEALALGDRLCIMRNGKILQVASATEIIHNPANEFVKEFFQKGDFYE